MNPTIRVIMGWIVGVVVVGLTIVGLAKLGGTSATGKNVNLSLVTDDHQSGPAMAKATLVEYGDFQCPACGAYEPIVEKVKQSYGDKLLLVFRNYPLPQHQFAQIAAQAAEAANLQGKYWEMHNLLYQEQNTWSVSKDINAALKGYAGQLGLDIAKFTTDLTSRVAKDRVQRDIDSGNGYQINGTPTFYLNGQELVLPISEQGLKDKIDPLVK